MMGNLVMKPVDAKPATSKPLTPGAISTKQSNAKQSDAKPADAKPASRPKRAAPTSTKATPPRIRTIALPVEHGSWGLTLEPILLGLLVAPTWAGAGLALGAFGAFLLRGPLKVAYTSLRQRRRERMQIALRFAALYALIAALGLGVAVSRAGLQPLWPLALALPFGVVFFIQDAQNQSRSWQAELAGPIAFAAIASCIALIDGWAVAPALALWAVLVARALTSVLYIRTRLRMDRGRSYQALPVIAAHGFALLDVVAMVWAGLLPLAVVGIFVLILLRTLWGLSSYRRATSIQALGVTEIGWGLATVLSVAAGI
ncbi:MAG: prenyltransferase [Chloroflexi bacterium]|nr:MAG: prenyltransferase [Chloroflexota bacterium]